MKTYLPARDVLAKIEKILATKPIVGRSPLGKLVAALHAARHYRWAGIYLLADDGPQLHAGTGPEPPEAAAVESFVSAYGKVRNGVSQADTPTSTTAMFALASPGRLIGVLCVVVDAGALRREDRPLLRDVARKLSRFLLGAGRYVMFRSRHAELLGKKPPLAMSTAGGKGQ